MKNILKLLLVLFPLMVNSQTQTENYIKTVTYKTPSTVKITAPTILQAAQTVTYFDGLGRPVQKIDYQQSKSGKDIVTHMEYDGFGRQVEEYLPFKAETSAMVFDAAAKAKLVSYYGSPNSTVNGNPALEATTNPFSRKELESSPLNRVLKQAAPGNDWRSGLGHEIKIDYQTNIANDVKLFTVTTTWNSVSGLYDIALGNAAANVFYTAAQLIKTVTYDENTATSPVETAGSTVEFKDKEGRVVLKRTYDAGIKHDTYYVYDIYGNLTYVIPPKADTAITAAILNDLCYQYKYDNENRMAEKKLPGKQWEFIVYDKLDRVVASGPANSPFSDLTTVGWLITKYDAFNRPVYTGWSTTSAATAAGRITLQAAQNSASVINENKQASGTIDGIVAYYTNVVSPTAFKLLTVNYYDNYTFPSTPAITVPTAVETQTVLTATQIKGLATASWTRVPTTSTAILGETTATFYDNNARPVRTYTTNHLGGYTYTDKRLDFSGKPQYSITRHRRLSTDTELMTKDVFTYSAQDRLLTQTHQINSGTVELIASNTYDELGQLISKKVGNTEAAPTQKVDYTYNIRGWLTGINDITTLTKSGDPKDLFAFKINYNTIPSGISGVLALYNGNIAETQWTSASETTPVIRTYGYKYDNLNRLKDAVFKRGTAAANNAYNETLTYDKNGNIMTLLRNGNSDTAANQIDNLTYTYLNTYSNQLTKVVDNATTYKGYGFVDSAANTINDYTYDANGNMISDNNKNVTAITYNHLNLPTKITFAATGNIVYIYNAVGQKVQKVVTIISSANITTTDYFDGYQYTADCQTCSAVLKFFPTAEGYVEASASSYKYIYHYKDHLGNIRLSYDKTLALQDENNYYPFGLKQMGYGAPVLNSNYKYKYNGKELQDELGLNMYDYHARNYDPSLGRWMNIDPLAEKSRRFNPYTYALDNPVFFIDPDGMQASYNWKEHDKGNKGVYTDGNKNVSFADAMGSVGKNIDGSEKSSEPDDWIKNSETGEVKWFNGTSGEAQTSANNYWGFFSGKGKTENLGSSFFGTKSNNIGDNAQIYKQQYEYLLQVSFKINELSGTKNIYGNNITLEFLSSIFLGTSFGNTTSKSSALPGVIWDSGGGVTVEKKFVKGLVSSTIFQLFDAFMSSQNMNGGTDKVAHERANAVNQFKSKTINFIDNTTLFKINMHKF